MKTNFLVLIFAFLFSFSSQAQFAWQNTSVGVGSTYNDIFFLPDSTGWAVTWDPANVYKTTNYGGNWTFTQNFPNTLLHSVFFASPTIGFIGGINLQSGINNIFRTTDGGQNWVKYTGLTPGSINGFRFKDSVNGYAFGYNGRLLSTFNSGLYWVAIPTGISAHIWDLEIIGDTMYLAADNLYRKVLGSSSMQIVYPEYMLSIDFLDGQVGYALSNTKVIKTIDGGRTWQIISSNPLSNLSSQGIKAISSSILYVSGMNNNIYISLDGGINWILDYQVINNYVIDQLVLFNSDLWAAGSGGQLLRKTNVLTSLNSWELESKLSIFPNPFESAIKLNKDFDQYQVYDLSGRIVSEGIVNDYTVDLNKLGAGLYFIKLQNKHTVIIKEIIKAQ